MPDVLETLALGVTGRVADLESQLAEANEGLADYAKEAVELRATIRRLEARCREYESYENEVAKTLLLAGAPSVVVPLERVKWAARRITEDRPITDERVRRILLILENADAYKSSGILNEMWHGIRKDLVDVLSAGAHIGRDEGPYHAARKIADNGRSDNIISTWFYNGSDGCWRVRQDALVAAIVEAIEEQVAIATEKKTALLAEIAGALTVVDTEPTYDGSGRRLPIAVLVPGPGVDDEAARDDLLARITALLQGRTS